MTNAKGTRIIVVTTNDGNDGDDDDDDDDDDADDDDDDYGVFVIVSVFMFAECSRQQ